MFFNSLSEEDVTVYNGTTAVSLGSVLSTGMTVSTSDGTSYTIIVAGDVTCDGKLDVSDISEILSHIRGDAVLEQPPLDAAAEAGGNDSINILAATAMLNLLL